MGSRLTIRAPRDYDFPRDVCSYGYFLLAPNRWSVARRTLGRPVNLADGPADLLIGQPSGPGTALRAIADRALSRPEQTAARRLIRRMLNLDDDRIEDFHGADPRWRASGRGRLLRSPTMFEDVIKTVTSCNVTWPSTVTMNERLCAVINPAFPTPRQLARRRPATLRARCRVGYRDARLVQLARLFAAGEVEPAWFEDRAVDDDEALRALLALPGIGPYAAANIMQLLGRYGHLPIDTETIRHGKAVLGMHGTDREIMRLVEAHYEPFGEHRFRSYWFELWDFYETKRGPAWTWEPKTTGKTFTAAQL